MQTICPYPGLRPFNEEESIFFKGREQQVERLVKRLEEKKFLMVNGASGDGKSSLIYAGVIPFAKAGFFKAKYNNWIVADFRPERSPLKNLTASICRQLKIDDLAQTEKELGYGFSALCDLYKASSFYIDESKTEWLNADEKERKVIKRKGANLLVLVDQFEEFFTNIENFNKGAPSVDSHKTVNLLLETYRLAIEENLPIYIICAMRSDFIGECASFRGLPEAVGYSQFFVPRLKRQEMEAVIEGPALLAGGSISKRLSQILIYSLKEGIDQLPVLQHTLNRLWILADNGGKELDLVHLAMAGGYSPSKLGKEDKIIFDKWYSTIPSYKKKLIENPSIFNVLDLHANELLYNNVDNFERITGNKIDFETMVDVIKNAFQTLTRSVDGRAIRRRTTLEELINLCPYTQFNESDMDALLYTFRDVGNNLLYPFIGVNDSFIKLGKQTVIDITHESLIRNWDLLNEWALEENDNYNTWKEVEKQLNRWIENDFSSNYLLAIGPLSIYKVWFEKFKPNLYWLLKYDESSDSYAIKKEMAKEQIILLERFIYKSESFINKKKKIRVASVSFAFLILSILLIWAIQQRSEAIKQKLVADDKTFEARISLIRAKNSEERALEAKNDAVELKNLAENSANEALKAKKIADNAKSEALSLKGIAEVEKNKAVQQSAIAIMEAEKAEKQRIIANTAKEKALIAEDKAKKLSMSSLAQNLAFKSLQIQKDNQLQTLLAVQAYKFTLNNNDDVQNSTIYEALRNANNGNKNESIDKNIFLWGTKDSYKYKEGRKKGTFYSKLENEPHAIAYDKNINSVFVSTKSNLHWGNPDSILSHVSIENNKEISNSFISLSSNGKYLLIENPKKQAILKFISKDKLESTNLVMNNCKIRKAVFNQSNNKLGLAYNDSLIQLYSLNEKNVVSTFHFNAKSKISAIVLSNDGKTIYYSTTKGDLNLLNLETSQSKLIYKTNEIDFESIKSKKNQQIIYATEQSRITFMAFDEVRNNLICGLSNGQLIKINTLNLEIANLDDRHLSQIEFIAFDSTGNYFASASADKTIKVFNLKNKENKPLHLKNHNEKVFNLMFLNEHTLLAGGESGFIWKWELSSTILANSLMKDLKRNFTKQEWNKNVGDEVEYELTVENLNK
jgi:WD40 repeat protein